MVKAFVLAATGFVASIWGAAAIYYYIIAQAPEWTHVPYYLSVFVYFYMYIFTAVWLGSHDK